ncbi:hypothetical protein ABPG77_005369 [Micractinium sp. CCAP 211/92]
MVFLMAPSAEFHLLGLPAAGVAPAQSLPDRFKQLRAVLLTDSPEVARAGKLAGCYAVHELASWPAPAQLAARISKLLQVRPWEAGSSAGLQAAAAPALPALAAVLQAAGAGAGAGEEAAAAGGAEEEEGDEVIDMLLLSLDAAHAPAGGSAGSSDARTHGPGEPASAGGFQPAAAAERGSDGSGGPTSGQAGAALAWADELLSQLNQAPGFRDTVLLSIVAGAGEQPLSLHPPLVQEQPLLEFYQGPEQPPPHKQQLQHQQQQQQHLVPVVPPRAVPGCPPVRRPLQSYQFAGQERVAVDGQRPAAVVHRLPGVIRVDGAAALCLEEVQARGAAGCVLAERLLPEVAYKLGRAPKYGA